jgi:hypothetical protein
MKKIFCILLMGIGLYPISEVFSQSRNVYWVHGLSGDANSLKPHDDYFKPIYQMNTYRPSVTTANGIQGAAQALAADPNMKADASNRNIVIAHSMGGVNSVWLHKMKGSSYVGGLVSMGSPYKGAYVANNLDNGVLDALIADGVKKGSQGIRNEPAVVAVFMTYTPVITTLNALFGTNVPTTLYKLMNDMASTALRKTIDQQVVQSATTRNSLKVGGSDINAIQQYSSFIVPSISLYGVEDYPATLRFLSSRLSREYNKSVDVVGLVYEMYKVCSAFSSTHSDQATVSLLTGNTLMYLLHRKLAADWAVSRDYWNGGFQSATDVLTGCYRTQTVTETYSEWVPSTIYAKMVYPITTRIKDRL